MSLIGHVTVSELRRDKIRLSCTPDKNEKGCLLSGDVGDAIQSPSYVVKVNFKILEFRGLEKIGSSVKCLLYRVRN